MFEDHITVDLKGKYKESKYHNMYQMVQNS